MPPKTFGARIRELRDAQGISLNKLSEVAGVSKAALHDLETKENIRPSADATYKLAAALGCRMEHLMGLPNLEGDGSNQEPNHLHELAELKKRLKQIGRIVEGAQFCEIVDGGISEPLPSLKDDLQEMMEVTDVLDVLDRGGADAS